MRHRFDQRSMKTTILSFALALIAASAGAHAGNPQRQADVARRGADVMPFSLAATQHVFTKTETGGTQRVLARDPRDAAQVQLVRRHLREIASQFRQGDFSGPAHIHGDEMPGLAQLRAAPPGSIAISYRDVPRGAELVYRTADPALRAALHSWFDAQVSDHGRDAMAGHEAMPGHEHHHMTGQ